MVLQILFRISQSNGRQEIHKMWIFLIEIHPEDGFLRGEIRFQILRLNAKMQNPDFPIEPNLNLIYFWKWNFLELGISTSINYWQC